MMNGKFKRAASRSAAVAIFVASLLTGTALADDQPFSNWFRYGSDINTAWKVVGDPTDPMQVSITSKEGEPKRAKRVLVLYPRASSAYDIAITKILHVFDTKEIDAEFKIINFETKDAQGKAAIQFAENNKFDLIFSMGSESTAWLYDNYRDGSLPVISVCSKDPVQLGQMKDYDAGGGSNFAFTSLNVPVEVQMNYIKDLKPGLKNIAVLVDSKNISAVQTQAEPIAKAARQSNMQVIMAAVQNPAKAKQELAQIVSDAVRTMRKNDPDLRSSIFLITGSTAVFREIRVINQHADRVPVISMIPEIVATGADTAALGIGISFESNAHLAAVYGAEVLSGKTRAGDLKVGIVSPPDIAISFLKAREIGMPVPFNLFETASFVYDIQGRAVRTTAHAIEAKN